MTVRALWLLALALACLVLALLVARHRECVWQRPDHGSGALSGVALEDRRLCAPARLESECFRRLGYQQVCR